MKRKKLISYVPDSHCGRQQRGNKPKPINKFFIALCKQPGISDKFFVVHSLKGLYWIKEIPTTQCTTNLLTIHHNNSKNAAMPTEEKTTQIKYKNIEWKVISNPKKDSLLDLQKKHRFHDLDIEDCLSEIQRPKIDEYDKYLFIVLHLPTMKGRGDKRHVETSEVKIFIGKNYLVTIHENNKTIEKVIAKVQSTLKTKKDYMALGTGYLLYMIVDDLFEDCFPILDDLSDQVNELEVEVFDMGKTRDRLKEILMLKKDLINLR